MTKIHLRIFTLLFMNSIGITLALLGAGIAPNFGFGSTWAAAAHIQAATPTPTLEVASRAGSTDGIMLMGLVIVVIVLLPILLRRSTWRR